MSNEGLTLEAAPWSPRRWALTIGVLFAGQIMLLTYFGERSLPVTPVRSFPTQIILVADAATEGRLGRNAAVNDPTLFALPHPRGFSGEAWLTYPPLRYELPAWTEPPRWLEMNEAAWSVPLAGHLPTNPPPSLAAIQTRPRLNDWPVYASPPSLPSASTLQLTGDLDAAEPLPALPSWPAREILSSSIVRVLVQPDGAVFSAVLLEESGLPEADRWALASARQLKFKPTPAGEPNQVDPGFRSVAARFRWHTLPEGQPTPTATPEPLNP